MLVHLSTALRARRDGRAHRAPLERPGPGPGRDEPHSRGPAVSSRAARAPSRPDGCTIARNRLIDHGLVIQQSSFRRVQAASFRQAHAG